MNLCLHLLILGAIILVAQSKSLRDDDKNIFCYFDSWAVYRTGNGKFDVENVDPNICTHIAFAFIGLNPNGTVLVLDPWESNPDGLDGFRRFTALKTQNPDLKVLVSIGGWNEGSAKFSAVAADPDKRAVLVKDVVEFLGKYDFDGLDFYWQYPGQRDSGNPADKENFVLILQELRTAFEPKGYILGAAVAPTKSSIEISYDVPALSEVLDYINILSYEYHGSYDNYVGHISPFTPAAIDAEYGNSELNVNASIQYWLDSGALSTKINLGIPSYAKTFTLLDSNKTELYSEISGGGKAGPYTASEGSLGYNEVCELYPDLDYIWDTEQQVPHLVSGDQWIGYENTFSIGIKAYYGVAQNLGGFMVYSLSTDDFRGLCGNQTYPVVNAIHWGLSKAGAKMKSNK